jgi:hypothetical protein
MILMEAKHDQEVIQDEREKSRKAETSDEIFQDPETKSPLTAPHSPKGSVTLESINNASETTSPSDAAYSSFSKSSKRWITFLVAMAGFFSPLSANIYFPALSYIAQDLNVSLELINLTVTAYLICQCITPSVTGDLADMVGRRPVYLLVLTVYFGANLGLSLQRTYAGLLVLRMIQSIGASGR